MTAFKQARLDNGLELSFSDGSNRYFGDYHRICVVATLAIPLERLDDDELRQQASAVFGQRLEVKKRLERLGVPSAELEQTRNAMVSDFLRHATTYLGRPDFPRRLVAAELHKSRSGRSHV